MAGHYEEIEHGGDTGLHVRAPDLETLFATAAEGMFELIRASPSDGTSREQAARDDRVVDRVAVTATDRESLLVRWLSELNYLHQTRQRIYHRFTIERLETITPDEGKQLAAGGGVETGVRLEAEARGEALAPEGNQVRLEIKAVTYHGLEIRETPEGIEARVIFDL